LLGHLERVVIFLLIGTPKSFWIEPGEQVHRFQHE
jgi:hypothetical protein